MNPSHWAPIESTWIVSFGCILLAVLPHQVPKAFRSFMRSWIGIFSIVGLAAWISTQKPVLGASICMMLIGVIVDGWKYESFLNSEKRSTIQLPLVTHKKKEKEKQKVRWFEEEVLMEDTEGVQHESSENLLMNRDKWMNDQDLNDDNENGF